ncbi:bactofilin family protein [Candidatus Magnetomonas plexicatena]|uniref:bactofilin family protein n=1 Tax=Candidatus Magnetomonas plexicatena TaxID=2552947 RepID=UPI001C759918|nr:polymer-forming cytoskeletal protein [Nitrospirales bacterium LBB_01]
MFTKKQDRIETLIGVNSEIKGVITLKGTLRVDGYFEGNVKADWVIVGEKGHIKGDMTANGVVVGGFAEGNIHASEYIEIMSKGRVLGDVFTQKLAIMEGGLFEGHSKMHTSSKTEKEVSVEIRTQIER